MALFEIVLTFFIPLYYMYLFCFVLVKCFVYYIVALHHENPKNMVCVPNAWALLCRPYEPCHEKTCILHMQKQRCRSAARSPSN